MGQPPKYLSPYDYFWIIFLASFVSLVVQIVYVVVVFLDLRAHVYKFILVHLRMKKGVWLIYVSSGPELDI